MSTGFPEATLKTLHPSAIHPFSTEHITLWGWGVGPRSPFIETDMPQGRSPAFHHLPTCPIATQATILSIVTLPQYRYRRHLDHPSVCVYILLLDKLYCAYPFDIMQQVMVHLGYTFKCFHKNNLGFQCVLPPKHM
jgi:hypothetical protein